MLEGLASMANQFEKEHAWNENEYAALRSEIDSLKAQLEQKNEDQLVHHELSILIQEIDDIRKKIDAHDADIQNAVTREEKTAKILAQTREENHDALRALTVKIQDLDNLWKKIAEHDADIQDIWKKEEQNRREFTDLWNKCKEIDHEFENSWQQDRKTGTELGELWNSYQMLRRELFYEIDYRLRRAASEKGEISSASAEHGTVNRERFQPTVKSSTKGIIAENDGKIRLNLGCGHIPVKGYINVDARDLPGVDVVADISSLPLK